MRKMVSRWLQGAWTSCAIMALPTLAWAAEGESAGGSSSLGLVGLAVAIGLGLAVIGAALGQAKAAAAALEGVARNPNAADKVFVPLLLSLSFIESLVLFVWVLMFILLGKV